MFLEDHNFGQNLKVRFTNFCDFYDFRKAVATAFLGIYKIPTINVEIHSFFFLFVQFVPSIVEFRVQTEKIFSYARSRKRNSYVIPVWSGKTVLEMLFVESTSLIRSIYLALPLQPLTELDCRVVPYDSKNAYNYTA